MIKRQKDDLLLKSETKSLTPTKSPYKATKPPENPLQHAIEVVGQVCRMEEGCISCGS